MPLPAPGASAVLLALVLVAPPTAQDHKHDPASEQLGTVAFATSCIAAAQPQFNRAVALLHSFEFQRAMDAFGATLKADPSCAMAEWGIALSRWSNPFAPGIRVFAARAPRRSNCRLPHAFFAGSGPVLRCSACRAHGV